MKKIFFLAFFLVACQHLSSVELGDTRVIVEVADTEEERAQGLMRRTSLEEDHGMLFLYPEERNVAFWMKNTKIPLDLIFIDSNFSIVDIHTAQPCTSEACVPYSPEKKAQHVLEVNAGFAERNALKTGDRVRLFL